MSGHKKEVINMEKITSFTIDHLKLIAGIYVSRIDYVEGHPITTFDLRMTSPNDEPVMNTAEMHTIEHLAATFLRNHPEFGTKTIYFGPMGCRTGFYFLVRDMKPEDAIALIQRIMTDIANYEGEIPGNTAVECGNYLEHDLEDAKNQAKEFLPYIANWTVEQLKYE